MPYAINYFLASPDGAKVAVGVSAGGSEDAALTVYDAATGRALTAALPRAQAGATGWSDNGRILYLNQLAALPAGAPPTEKYQNSVVLAWDLHAAPVAVVSSRTPGPITVPAPVFPFVSTVHGGPVALATLANGVQNEVEVWTGPRRRCQRARRALDPAHHVQRRRDQHQRRG